MPLYSNRRVAVKANGCVVADSEKVFGWRNVHQHNDRGGLYGKRGHWRLAKVLNYSTNPAHAYSIDERMEEVGKSDRYAL